MTTLQWIAVIVLACGPLLAFLAGAELANRHDLRARRATRRKEPRS